MSNVTILLIICFSTICICYPIYYFLFAMGVFKTPHYIIKKIYDEYYNIIDDRILFNIKGKVTQFRLFSDYKTVVLYIENVYCGSEHTEKFIDNNITEITKQLDEILIERSERYNNIFLEKD